MVMLIRSSYQRDKMVSAAARKIYEGEKVAPIKKVSKDQASWLLSVGEGFGKQQYRFALFWIKIIVNDYAIYQEN